MDKTVLSILLFVLGLGIGLALVFLFNFLRRNSEKRNEIDIVYYNGYSVDNLYNGDYIFEDLINKCYKKREEYEYFDECLYKYLDENNLDIVQTTLEVNPYEELNIKESFNNFNKLRYKTLYFRSSGKVKDYKKTIEFMNEVYDHVKNKFK